MGSIPIYHPFEDWIIKASTPDGSVVRVTVGELDDHYGQNSPINVNLTKEVYDKIMSGEYRVRQKGRDLQVLGENDVEIVLL